MTIKTVTKTEIFVFMILSIYIVISFIGGLKNLSEFENELINETVEIEKKMMISCMFDGVGWGTDYLEYDEAILYDYQIRCSEEQGKFEAIISD